jgi:putative endonuclease
MTDVVHIRELGRLGERIARRFLADRGCATVASNARADGGELDLVVRDGSQLVAVEVKTTSDGSDPVDVVDDRKMGLVGRTASSVSYPISRIDIVGIRLDASGVEIRWLRGPD